MISVQLTQKKFWENDVECYIFLMSENLESVSDLASLDKIEKDFYPHVKEILKKHKFAGKHGQNFVLTAMKDKKLIQFMFVGLGKLKNSWHRELELLRRAVAGAVEKMKSLDIQAAVVALPEEKPFGVDAAQLVKQLTIVAFMIDYEFIKFKSNRKDKEWAGTLFIETDPKDQTLFVQALQQGVIIGQAVNQARNWADLPANILTPSELAREAKRLADEFNLQCNVFGEQKAKELGMGGFLCVDAGSDQPGQFVVLEYHAGVKNADIKNIPTIALVGKGVCFDTGGVSLKPSDAMHGMKFDMTGAAAVIATMKVLAQLKPEVNVIGITPLVENMPSGKASRQDDIVTFMNGKTAEIKSTDAEGRLILADALCYAEKNYKPEVIIDIATLTGACSYALGHFYSAIMTRDEALSDSLQRLGRLTGDKLWPLPLEDDYTDAIKSDVADLSNSGSRAYLAGTITATCFLENFVEKARWAHLDIAGTADGIPGINYMGKGASGVGVRLFVDFVMNYKKSE